MNGRRPTRWIPLLVASLLALLATAASARPATSAVDVVIKVGDAVAIAGTHIGCYGVTGDGKDGVVCFKVDSNGLAPGTFGVGAVENGEVAAYKIRSNREPKRIFKRTLAAADEPALTAASAKTIKLGVGKIFNLEGTSLLCQIVKVTKGVPPLYRGVKVGCFRADAAGPLPSAYGVALTDRFAGVFRFDSSRNAGPNIFVRAQP